MLTKASIDKLTWDPKGSTIQVLWDSEIPGFGVRVYETGRKAFIMRYTLRGKRSIATLGQYGTMTLDQARKAARINRGELESGANPFVKKSDGMDWRQYCDVYMREHGSTKKSAKLDAQRIASRVIPALGDKALIDTTREDIATLFRTVGATAPYEANRLLSLISVMWSTAAKLGLVPFDVVNPTKWIKRYPEVKRDRFIQESEMAHLRESLSEVEDPYIRALFVLYMFTGVRKKALSRIKWSHVDLKKGTLSVYQTKAKRDLHVPLSQDAIEVLKSVPKNIASDYVFPGGEDGHIGATVIDRAWSKLKEATKARGSNIDDVRIHDLRRTFGSWLASNGVSIATIMELMDITQHSTAKVYMRFQQQALRDAVNLVSSKMLSSKGS